MAANKFVTQCTLVSANGSLGGTLVADFEIEGNKSLDGPSYLDSLLKSAYEAIHQDFTITDCRCSVGAIHSTARFHHYSCAVAVRGNKDGQDAVLHDNVTVYVDRSLMRPA